MFKVKEKIKMNLITVNQDKCTKCGLCVNECPEYILELSENGPKEICGDECISCGHCVAICPMKQLII